MNTATTFEPSRHLTTVGGADYLEVKWRLVWLRQTHPDAEIETELVTHDDRFALFRARVRLPGGGSSTGWGSESVGDFRDYIEKAETKAIGRALAALGFGTQFCPDFDFGATRGRVVDAPIDFASTRGRRLATPEQRDNDRRIASVEQPASQRQISYVRAIVREIGLDDDGLAEELAALSVSALDDISRRDASALIERLQSRRTGTELAS